ncbi:MAG: hypothetical protein U0165_18595 [Polyangiaceae bacterium]
MSARAVHDVVGAHNDADRVVTVVKRRGDGAMHHPVPSAGEWASRDAVIGEVNLAVVVLIDPISRVANEACDPALPGG